MVTRDSDGRGESADADGGNRHTTSRRTFVKTTALTAFGAVGASAAGTGAAQTASGFGLDAGFADTSWLDDSARVIKVQEATRSAVEAAFHASGKRIVAFETSGTIDLGGDPLAITEDYCWVAGQTAPSPGITFVKGQVQIAASNCVVQHVRSRHGPGSGGEIQSNDSLNTADGTTNNVVDHVSASWGTDECMSVGYETDRTTYANNLVYEGLYDPYGDGSDHNYCTLVGDGADRVALVGNVWAKGRSRIPRLKGETRSAIVNNLAYFFDEGCNMDSSAATSFVGNKYVGTVASGDPVVDGDGTVYLADNATADPALDADVSISETDPVDARPLWPDGLDPLSVDAVEKHTLANAGARPADRTQNDARIVQEIQQRAGDEYLDSEYDYWIPDPSAVGGYPDLPENTHTLNPPSSDLRGWLREWAGKVEPTGSAPETPETPIPGEDVTPPTTVADLQVGRTTSSAVTATWAAASDDGSGLDHYRVVVDRAPQDGTDDLAHKQTTVPAGTTQATVEGLEAGTEYRLEVTAVDAAGNESDAATVTAATESATEDRTGGYGPITVEGGGTDIWNDADAFHYYSATTSGDFDVAVNVESVAETDPFAKAGLMVRESLDADAQNVMVRRRPGSTGVQWRAATGGTAESTTSDEGQSESEVSGGTSDHAWQRLVRSGDRIRAYSSPDGVEWTLLADLSLSLPDQVQVGLAVTSHAAGTLCTATFDSVTGIRLGTSRDVGSVEVAGDATVSGPTPTDPGTPSTDGPGPVVQDRAPTDPDDDGHYEDVNGDEELDFNDLVAYYQHKDEASMSDETAAFDYNDDGSLDFNDLVALYQELQG